MRLRGNLLLALGISGAFALFLACGSDTPGSNFDNGKDAGNGGPDAETIPDSGGGFGEGGTTCNPCNDFPATPIIDGASDPDAGGPAVTAAPANAVTLFGAAGTGAAGGPCVFEPEVGTLYPNNWLRPRFRYVTGAQNLFEIRLHTAKETNDLVVYTRSDRWTMPKAMWQALAAHVQGDPITMTVRGAVYDETTAALTSGPLVGSTGDISVAPAQAQGGIIYWVTSTASLKGFQVGDESVSSILTPAQLGQSAGCVGCHGSAGDGKFVLAATVPDQNGSDGNLSMTTTDGTASPPDGGILSAAGSTLLARRTQDAPTSSGAHFQPGDRLIVSNYNDGTSNQIIWTDLEATSTTQYSGTGSYAGTGWGVFARTGDTLQGGQAAFSHDGKTIAYVSATTMAYGIAVISRDADIKTIPFGDRAGGAATPVLGASDPAYSEFYPTFSPQGDKLLAFDRVPAAISNPIGDGNGDNYANPLSELYAVPSAGAPTATRLSANDPPACLSQVSPGVSNSWPKWAPSSTDVGGKTYYWLVFSSTREFNYPQLYLTAVVVDDATGAIDASHAALHLWNQPEVEHNHTPAWDFFSVPPNGPR